jgi:hypothetical protein
MGGSGEVGGGCRIDREKETEMVPKPHETLVPVVHPKP